MTATGIEAKVCNDIAQRLGRWVLVGPEKTSGPVKLCLARCDCGTEKWVNFQNLKQGKSKSCGCHRVEVSQKINLKHGMSATKTYKIWAGMKRRCTNPNEKFYAHYGGRGIKVDEAWSASFDRFLEDMGECPEGYSIERIDVNGDYTKNNCKWIPESEQPRNTRKTKLTMSDAAQIRALVASGGHAPSIAKQYGVDRTMVNKIVRGECWA